LKDWSITPKGKNKLSEGRNDIAERRSNLSECWNRTAERKAGHSGDQSDYSRGSFKIEKTNGQEKELEYLRDESRTVADDVTN